MIASQCLALAIARLKSANVDDAVRDARVLLAHAVGIEPARLVLLLQDDLSAHDQKRFETLITRRAAREPVSHIIGSREFYGRQFKVSSDVLDPRPDTETLIDLALKAPFERVLDLGVGSGAILLTLLAERQSAHGVGVDVSDNALRVAAENSASLAVTDRVDLHLSNWLENVHGKFDLIVSNPPYIDEAEWQTLQPEVRKWEPKIALTPGQDGLAPYQLIATQASRYLDIDGRVLVEIGWQQGADVAAIFRDAGWTQVSIHTDLNGKDRAVLASAYEKPLQKSQD